jgi:anthranilate phosphoribosyltransferase
LGPLTNPAGARYQLLGVYDASLCVRLANVLKILGSVSAMVVHGEDGSDEVSITGRTHIAELRDGEIKEYNILPGDFGIKCAAISDIRGGYLSENVKITESILRGEESPKKDAVILNAGCALYITKKAESIKEGVDMARDAIESGSALSKLELLREISNR